MKRNKPIAVSRALILSLTLGMITSTAASAGSLTDFHISRSNTQPGQATNLVVEYTIESLVASKGFIFQMEISNAFSKPTNTTATSIYNSGMSLEINGDSYTGAVYVARIQKPKGRDILELRLEEPVSAGSRVKITIDDTILENTNTPGSYSFSKVQTANQAGSKLDDYLPVVTLTTIAPPPIPTLGEWAMLGMASLLAATAGLVLYRRRMAAIA